MNYIVVSVSLTLLFIEERICKGEAIYEACMRVVESTSSSKFWCIGVLLTVVVLWQMYSILIRMGFELRGGCGRRRRCVVFVS